MTRKVIALTTLAVGTAVAAAGTAMADAPFPGPGGGHRGPGSGRGGMRDGHHRLGMLLVLVALVAAVALVTWLLARRRSAAVTGAPLATVAGPTATAEAILAERLARGEIEPDDYAARLAALRGATPTP